MIGTQDRWQGTLFVAGSLDQLIPDDHILKRVDRILDLSWLRNEVSDCYCETNGRPGIDPEAAVRLMLAGFFQGIVHDRKLMREAQVNLAIRWFAGYRLEEALPDHSSLTRIRQRWGADRFRKVFQKTVVSCIEAGLVNGETIHMDATLIRADVSWESLTTAFADKVLEENEAEDRAKKRGRPRTRPRYPKKRSKTDPDATLATSNKKNRLEPTYKQHTTVDDRAGVIVDVELTTGEVNEGKKLIEVFERIEELTEQKIKRITADATYGHPVNYGKLEECGIDAVIPPQRESRKATSIPKRRFPYDGKHKVVTCPAGKRLKLSRVMEKGWLYRAKRSDCRACRLNRHCLPPTGKVRTILIVNHYEALLRARRRKVEWDEATRGWYSRHRWRVEGVHGEAKTQHGLRRAARRGLSNVAIQVYLTAAVMNLKRLAAFWLHYLCHILSHQSYMETGGLFYRRLRERYQKNRLGLPLAA